MLNTNNAAPDSSITLSPRSDHRHAVILGELSALIGLTLADAWGFVPVNRTPFLLLLCWASLRLRGLPWRSIGFTRPPRMARAIAVGMVAGLAIELFAINVTTPWIATVTGASPGSSASSW